MPFFKPTAGIVSPFFNSVAASAASSKDGKVMGQGPFGAKYYLSGALAGGICCSITHGALTPVDVVKTRIQLDPTKYNQGFLGGFKQIIAEEGAGALLTGLGPTAQGYFIQGWFKFGGVEFFKINITSTIGEEAAWNNKTSIYLLASAMAETIADVFLCPCAHPPHLPPPQISMGRGRLLPPQSWAARPCFAVCAAHAAARRPPRSPLACAPAPRAAHARVRARPLTAPIRVYGDAVCKQLTAPRCSCVCLLGTRRAASVWSRTRRTRPRCRRPPRA